MSNGQPPSQPAPNYAAQDDALLVRRFANCRDEDAFAELVRRYRGLVYGVAQRVLSQRQDVEDVFQATFLVLARDAAGIRNRASAASWLYGVAHRLALKARARRAAQRETPLKDETMDHANPLAELAQRSELQALDEELNELPERYREPLVLHYLLGRTNRQIAEELRMTVAAVEGRLKRGRDRLRKRLARRGVGLIAVLAALQLGRSAAEAAVTESLTAATIQAGLSYTSAGPSHPLYSHEAAHLAAKELTTMTTTSLGTLGVMALVTTLVVGLAIGLSGPENFLAAGDDASPVLQATALPAGKRTPDELRVRVAAENGPAGNATSGDAGAVTEGFASTGGAMSKALPEKLTYYSRSPAREKIEAELQKQTQIDFVDTSLKDALDFLADLHKIQILIDRQSLADAGVDPNTVPINLSLSKVSLRSVLNIILRRHGLTWVVRNEVLEVTTKVKADEMLETHLYETRRINMDPNQLVKVIRKTTSGPWFDEEGVGGTIEWVPGGLVIRQTQKVHREVEDLLQQFARQPALSATDLRRYESQWKEYQKEQERKQQQAERQDRINTTLYRMETLLKKLEELTRKPAGKQSATGAVGGFGGLGGGFGAGGRGGGFY